MKIDWFIAQTEPGRELIAWRGLKERGFTSYLPMETRWKPSRKVRERADYPLFAGYVFVGLAPWQSHMEVRAIDGIRGFVMLEGQPAKLPAVAVYDFQARQMAGEFDHTPPVRCDYRPGQQAKVTLAGPYRGLIGEIVKADEAGRIKLLLSAKWNMMADLDCDDIEIVEPKKAA